MGEKAERMIAFENVATHEELKKYLIDKASNLQNTRSEVPRYFCHYTKLGAAVSIIQGKKWYIGSPLRMNDGLELSHAGKDTWKKIFFACFMLEPKESIAMWSMYAQPWTDGVMIRIPVEKYKEWIKSDTLSVYAADASTKKPTQRTVTDDVERVFHAVAYTDAEISSHSEKEQLLCGLEYNTKIKDALISGELVGYIKNMAWAYENEYRLQINYKGEDIPEAVAISIPESVVDSIEIVAGPRFSGNLLDRVEKEIGIALTNERVHSSIYQGKLNWVFCDDCERTRK